MHDGPPSIALAAKNQLEAVRQARAWLRLLRRKKINSKSMSSMPVGTHFVRLVLEHKEKAIDFDPLNAGGFVMTTTSLKRALFMSGILTRAIEDFERLLADAL